MTPTDAKGDRARKAREKAAPPAPPAPPAPDAGELEEAAPNGDVPVTASVGILLVDDPEDPAGDKIVSNVIGSGDVRRAELEHYLELGIKALRVSLGKPPR